MLWQKREEDKAPGSVVVILDGKNTPGDIHAGLTKGVKEKFPIYVFVANSNGSRTVVKPGDAMVKGSDYSRQYREKEIEHIVALDRKVGVGVLVVSNDGIYASSEELTDTVNTLRKKIPEAKVVIMGADLELEKPADAFIRYAQPSKLKEQLETWGIFSTQPVQGQAH